MQLDALATYEITLVRVPYMGSPIFYSSVVPASSSWGARAAKYDFTSEPDAKRPKSVQKLTLTPTKRAQSANGCTTVNTSLKGDGTQTCFVAIGVTCSDGKQCAYRLKIEQKDLDSSIRHTLEAGPGDVVLPPGPILDSEYTNGRVSDGQIKYYYFPVIW